jgi:hypothetical protein
MFLFYSILFYSGARHNVQPATASSYFSLGRMIRSVGRSRQPQDHIREGHECRRHDGVHNRQLEAAGTMRDACTNEDVSGKKMREWTSFCIDLLVNYLCSSLDFLMHYVCICCIREG